MPRAPQLLGQMDDVFWVPTTGALVAEDLVNGDFTAFQGGHRSEEWAHFAVRTSE